MSLNRDLLRGITPIVDSRLMPLSERHLGLLLGGSPTLIDVTGVQMEDSDIPKACDWRSLPPFNEAWIEWRDQGTQESKLFTCAARVSSIPIRSNTPIRALLYVASVAKLEGNGVLLGTSFVPLGRDGEGIMARTASTETIELWNEMATALAPKAKPLSLDFYRNAAENAYLEIVLASEALEAQHIACTNIALFTFSLLNCRNVALAPTEKPRGFQRRVQSKHGYEWHRLVVVKPGLKRNGATVGHGNGEPMTRSHMVRGHFKEFTESAPLFGRWTGRWWWSPANRGDRDLGVVEKEYEVRA